MQMKPTDDTEAKARFDHALILSREPIHITNGSEVVIASPPELEGTVGVVIGDAWQGRVWLDIGYPRRGAQCSWVDYISVRVVDVQLFDHYIKNTENVK